jgi:hypothetical protein
MKYESPITNHSQDMINIKAFADREKDWADRPKTICPLIFPYGDITKRHDSVT